MKDSSTDSSTGPKGGKQGRKHGRNKAGCAAYKASNSAAFRKARRIAKHLRNANGNDLPSVTALTAICKADSKAAKAFLPLRVPATPSYLKRMDYNHKRLAKAKRQLDKAHTSGNGEAILKACYYVERFSP